MSWLDRLRDWRNRTLASRKFQNWAASFPLTRPIARSQVRQMFDLCAGFVYSQVLLSCVQLNLIDRLNEQPRSAAELETLLKMPAMSVVTLMRAAESLGLVEKRGDGKFHVGPKGAVLLGNPGIVAMITHHAMLYQDLADPVAMLRNGRSGTSLQKYWAYADNRSSPDDLATDRVADYSGLMAESQPFIAEEILAAYSFENQRHRCLLDVGGGNGSFISAVAEHTSSMELRVFDLPAVAELANQRFERAGLQRARAFGGDMRKDPLPEGVDIISLVRILHDHDDDSVLEILRNARKALPDGGTLLIAEPMSGTPGALPVGDAYFGFYLYAMGSGRPRTSDELSVMLEACGFNKPRELKTRVPLLTRVMVTSPA